MSNLRRTGLIGLLILGAACSSTLNEDPVGSVQSRLAIESIEINQALGVQYMNARKFVAGKSTAIIVYVDAPVAVDASAQKVVVTKDGAAVATLTPEAAAEPTKRLVFQCPSLADCGSWAPGSYTFDATVGGVTTSASASFVKRRSMRILAVPVKVTYGGANGASQVVEISDARWKKSIDFVKATFPVAPDDVNWVIRDTLDMTAVDANTDAGRYKIWQALTDLNPATCAANKKGPECFDVVSGFVKSRMGNTPGAPATLQGYTYALPGVVSVNDDDDLDATVAHEISHPYGIGDEYQGGQFNCNVNPVPASYVGKDFNDASKTDHSCAGSTETAPPEALGTGVLVAAATWHPFDTTGRGFLKDVAGYMGSGAPQKDYWVQPRVYDRLFDQFAPVIEGQGPLVIAKVVGFEAEISADSGAPSGFVATVEPLYTFDGPSPGSPATNTEWYARTVDSGGNVLSSMNSTVTFAPNFEPPRAVADAAMRGSLVLPVGATKIQIMRSTSVVKEIAVSANAPVVALTGSITAGQVLSGTSNVAWTMTDADNDPLIANVEYSHDDQQTWSVVDDDLAAGQVAIDWDHLPGGEAGKSFVRVVVTDGVKTTVATSAGFTVPKKAPEVYIETAPGTHAVGETVELEGEGNDLTGDLDQRQLVWSSSLDGALGAGSTIFASRLKAGTHVITLTGTNAVGVKGTATVSITMTAGNNGGAGGPGADGGGASPGGAGATPGGNKPASSGGCSVGAGDGDDHGWWRVGALLGGLGMLVVRRRRRSA